MRAKVYKTALFQFMHEHNLTLLNSVNNYNDLEVGRQLQDLTAIDVGLWQLCETHYGALCIHSDYIDKSTDIYVMPDKKSCTIVVNGRSFYTGVCDIEEYLDWQSIVLCGMCYLVWPKSAVVKGKV